jgi:hypothetical protein
MPRRDWLNSEWKEKQLFRDGCSDVKQQINPDTPLEGFADYVERLGHLLASSDSEKSELERIELALDGEPGRELRRYYSLTDLRASGTFLTGSNLANTLVAQAMRQISDDAVFCDPACGAGDLLVAAARHLPVGPDLEQTLADWGRRLVGFDLQPLLVRAARTRLALLAIRRGVIRTAKLRLDLDALFPHIRVCDGTGVWRLPTGPICVLVNPPFTRTKAPQGCQWASGSVSQAALFIEACLLQAIGPFQMHAILPDVLRTGSRYEKWRRLMNEKARVGDVMRIGLFDRWTDVDVFTARFEIPGNDLACDWGVPPKTAIPLVGDSFEIRVGSIVSYRHEHKGPWLPFAHARRLPLWARIKDLPERIRSTGKSFRPPFVLVRRTSRPGDRFRAVGTIITGNRDVAVENHLLVALPKDRTLRSCRALLKVLRHPASNAWLNQRICCRHLTVSALRDLPWRIWDE